MENTEDFRSGYEYARRRHQATWQGYPTGILLELAAAFDSAESELARGQGQVIKEILAKREGLQIDLFPRAAAPGTT